jgi:hypothetical protein
MVLVMAISLLLVRLTAWMVAPSAGAVMVTDCAQANAAMGDAE